MKKINLLFIVATVVFLGGCAVGNKYDYQASPISLPVSGTEELRVGVVENRAYVLNGEKTPDFIGLQRGGFNNPFDVKTKSGKPLPKELALALANALNTAGFSVNMIDITSVDNITEAVSTKSSRKTVVLTISDWKTDVYMNMTLHFDLQLQVFSTDGTLLAENQVSGKESLGGAGMPGQNARTAAAAFETKIGRLFNTMEIINALAN